MKKLFVVCLLAFASACAHVDPLTVTGESLDLTEKSFQATKTGMAAANAAQLLSPATVHAWNTFMIKYSALYPATVKMWDTAKAEQNATAQQEAADLLAKLATELATFVVSPDGGVI